MRCELTGIIVARDAGRRPCRRPCQFEEEGRRVGQKAELPASDLVGRSRPSSRRLR